MLLVSSWVRSMSLGSCLAKLVALEVAVFIVGSDEFSSKLPVWKVGVGLKVGINQGRYDLLVHQGH